MHEVAAAEIVVMENLSVDEDKTTKEDGDEAVLYICNVYNYIFFLVYARVSDRTLGTGLQNLKYTVANNYWTFFV